MAVCWRSAPGSSPTTAIARPPSLGSKATSTTCSRLSWSTTSTRTDKRTDWSASFSVRAASHSMPALLTPFPIQVACP
eukprot:6845118-Pyramimonas_sp.AAC.1